MVRAARDRDGGRHRRHLGWGGGSATRRRRCEASFRPHDQTVPSAFTASECSVPVAMATAPVSTYTGDSASTIVPLPT